MKKEALSEEATTALRTTTGFQGNTLSRLRLSAAKPNYEAGASTQLKLSFAKKTPKPGEILWCLCNLLLCACLFEIDNEGHLTITFCKLVWYTFSIAEKPALDPSAAKMWTLSANDMDDDDVVSISVWTFLF